MRRLGVAMGAEPVTFSGLSGLGDLFVTAASRHSRNAWAGREIGKGRRLEGNSGFDANGGGRRSNDESRLCAQQKVPG